MICVIIHATGMLSSYPYQCISTALAISPSSKTHA